MEETWVVYRWGHFSKVGQFSSFGFNLMVSCESPPRALTGSEASEGCCDGIGGGRGGGEVHRRLRGRRSRNGSHMGQFCGFLFHGLLTFAALDLEIRS